MAAAVVAAVVAFAILAAYAAGLVWYWRVFAVAVAEFFYKEFPRTFGSFDRYMAAFIGLWAALIWPLAGPVFHARHLVRHTVVPPSERAHLDEEQRERDQAELARLRALARKYGLPVEGLADDSR